MLKFLLNHLFQLLFTFINGSICFIGHRGLWNIYLRGGNKFCHSFLTHTCHDSFLIPRQKGTWRVCMMTKGILPTCLIKKGGQLDAFQSGKHSLIQLDSIMVSAAKDHNATAPKTPSFPRFLRVVISTVLLTSHYIYC